MLVCAGLFFTIGAAHLFLTFFTRKLDPSDPGLRTRMREVPLILIQRTDIWRCWVGFNVSHSIALMLFGVIYGFLVAAHSEILFNSPFLLGVGLLMIAAIFALG